MAMDAFAVLARSGDTIGSGLLHALRLAFGMTWEITWALILGFTLSAIVRSVSKRQMTRLLPDDRPRTLALACGRGGVQLLLVCGGGAGLGDLPQGRQLHRRELERILRIPGPEP